MEFSRAEKCGHLEENMNEHFRGLATVVFLVVMDYGGPILWVTEKLGVSYGVLDFSH